MRKLRLKSKYAPAGDQKKAIKQLTENIESGIVYQTLLGATGTGKTFTLANVIEKTQKPTILLAHNKTLAAQLYGEMKEFFPNNAVEYFVSYYDYYQPEAYVVASDTFIEKDASINEHIEQMRLSATKSVLERKDVIIVASVSAIYGLGDPDSYMKMLLSLKTGDNFKIKEVLERLSNMQYTRNDLAFARGTYRLRGDTLDIFPADSDKIAFRCVFFDDELEKLYEFDPLTGEMLQSLVRTTIYPKTHYATPKETIYKAVEQIKIELKERKKELLKANKLVEEQRLSQRTLYDIEMMNEMGFCSGVENYSRYLSNRNTGQAPPTLLDYFKKDSLVIIDESHVTVPQIGAMYKGDRARKENLVEYGFRLPSALDNRPLKFNEFENLINQVIYVSATPGDYEIEKSQSEIIEQVIRPTSLLDPKIQIKPINNQVDSLLDEIRIRTEKKQRVLVTTLTKKMAENLTDYLADVGVTVRYLHSDIGTVERVEIIRDLRLGVFDVLVGINLLREGLDLPEVSLVAILDADKEGFLRSYRSLVQTIGRAARHLDGCAILYADKITKSMRLAIDETNRRREIQQKYNKDNNLSPKALNKSVENSIDLGIKVTSKTKLIVGSKKSKNNTNTAQGIASEIKLLDKKMLKCAQDLEFEKAANLRDEIKLLKDKLKLV